MQHFTSVGTLHVARQAAHALLPRWLVSLAKDLHRDWRLRRTVETLSALDDRTLSDIGIRREEIHWVVSEKTRRW
jgi:uncharacterized protein YjiS (DUF1127 family)